jgi:leucyl/phenylalanyl-tRNA--protein transferase
MIGTLLNSLRRSSRTAVLKTLAAIPNSQRRLLDIWFDLQIANATAETVLQAYLNGRFPLTEPETGRIFWKAPNPRGIMPIDGFVVPRNLKRLLRQDRFQVSINQQFDDVARGCGDRPETWITPQIVDLYCELHRMGFAHSFESWQDGKLVGGYLGVSLGAYFVGVSQFNQVRDAGKISFLHCMHCLRSHRFLMHDVQEPTSHLEQFGCFGLAPDAYRTEFLKAIAVPARLDWFAHTEPRDTSEVIAEIEGTADSGVAAVASPDRVEAVPTC